MRRWGLLVAALALIIGGLAGLAVLVFAGGRSGTMEAMFIEEMVPHHDDAIAMADLALERSRRPEIRRLASDVKRTQTRENAQMREWYREWYGAEVPEGGRMEMMMGSMTDLDALRDAEDFDREFLEQMIPHHEMAVRMSGMMGSGSARAEFREFTENIAREQTREIRQMRDWYDDWYGGQP